VLDPRPKAAMCILPGRWLVVHAQESLDAYGTGECALQRDRHGYVRPAGPVKLKGRRCERRDSGANRPMVYPVNEGGKKRR